MEKVQKKSKGDTCFCFDFLFDSTDPNPEKLTIYTKKIQDLDGERNFERYVLDEAILEQNEKNLIFQKEDVIIFDTGAPYSVLIKKKEEILNFLSNQEYKTRNLEIWDEYYTCYPIYNQKTYLKSNNIQQEYINQSLLLLISKEDWMERKDYRKKYDCILGSAFGIHFKLKSNIDKTFIPFSFEIIKEKYWRGVIRIPNAEIFSNEDLGIEFQNVILDTGSDCCIAHVESEKDIPDYPFDKVIAFY